MSQTRSGTVSYLDATNLRALARGCGVLACGTAGDAELGLAVALVAVEERGPVPVVALDDLPGEALVLPCGMMGAAGVASERIFSGEEGQLLCSEVAALQGRPVCALMCLQIGGINGLLPVAWASRAGLPLVDADGAGRAFPAWHPSALGAAGVPTGPVVLTAGRGNVVIIHSVDDASADRLVRGATAALGGLCVGTAYAAAARRLRGAAIAGSVSRAVAAGASVCVDGGALDPEGVADALDGELLVRGQITHLDRSSATVGGLGSDAGRQVRLERREMFMMVLEDGAIRAAVPDLITVLDISSGVPIPTEDLRHGDRVAVLTARSDEVWRAPAGRAIAGPHAFGYELNRPDW